MRRLNTKGLSRLLLSFLVSLYALTLSAQAPAADSVATGTELVEAAKDTAAAEKGYFDSFLEGFGYAHYLFQEITFGYDWKPWWQNYFYWLLLLSGFFLVLEWVRPWRENQPRFRKDFWLDFFYMFFNFFLFWLVIYNSYSMVAVHLFNDFLGWFGVENVVAIEIDTWPAWAQLLTLFLVADFVQWWGHRILHTVPWLWEFHKLHHSVEQMGFAAHLRYHWVETVFYRSLQYLPLAMIGFGIEDFFLVHIFTLAVGHFNHSNITVAPRVKGLVLGALFGLFISEFVLDNLVMENLLYTAGGAGLGAFLLGPLTPYLFNSPEMHIWHHAHDMPDSHPNGINFGITLAIWDYIFGTAHMPHNGRDIKLGFPGLQEYPQTFWAQITHGFSKKNDSEQKEEKREEPVEMS